MKRTSKRAPGRSRGGYRAAGESRSLSTGLPQLAAARDHADSPPLARAKSQWLVGDWNALCELDADTIASHPERDRLALLVACAHQQRADHELAREYTRRAIGWGCDPKLVARLLISGVHNTLGRVAALKADDSAIDSHFTQALAVTGDAESSLATPTRAVRELAALGLLPHATRLLRGQVDALCQAPHRPGAFSHRLQSLLTEVERLHRASIEGEQVQPALDHQTNEPITVAPCLHGKYEEVGLPVAGHARKQQEGRQSLAFSQAAQGRVRPNSATNTAPLTVYLHQLDDKGPRANGDSEIGIKNKTNSVIEKAAYERLRREKSILLAAYADLIRTAARLEAELHIGLKVKVK